jgi:hypothetical protein
MYFGHTVLLLNITQFQVGTSMGSGCIKSCNYAYIEDEGSLAVNIA